MSLDEFNKVDWKQFDATYNVDAIDNYCGIRFNEISTIDKIKLMNRAFSTYIEFMREDLKQTKLQLRRTFNLTIFVAFAFIGSLVGDLIRMVS